MEASKKPRNRKKASERAVREHLEQITSGLYEAAVNYIDSHVAPERVKATDYYMGRPFGDEEAGRSQIVMSEVSDVVQAILPSLIRVFLSGEHPVEFVPTSEAKVAEAEQATDYVRYIITKDNPGFDIFWAAFKDALIRKTGIFKWWFDETVHIEEDEFSGIDDEQIALLMDDPEIEIIEMEALEEDDDGAPDAGMAEDPSAQAAVDPMTGAPLAPAPKIPLYEIKIRRTHREPKFVVECVPPEELIIDPAARSLEDANYIGHRQLKTLSELTAMGYDKDDIVEAAGSSSEATSVGVHNLEAVARNPALQARMNADIDPTMQPILYVESYIRTDADDDGVAELYRVCSVGDAQTILHVESVPEAPFAIICPDPEPHMVIGRSVADQTVDLQRIKSGIVRNTLDSLAQSIFPRTAIVEGQVNIDDAMNTEIGSIIRMRAPGMVQPLETPFVGQYALSMLGYIDDVRAQRTGISRATQGLDADVLQSTTKAAVTATVSAAQERLEMIARVFAETGIKRLFRGVYRMVKRHQDRARMIKLRGQWVAIDPRPWDADMAVEVNVGLGEGDRVERTALLTQVAASQKETLLTLGPDNPLVTIEQYRNTLAKILEINGVRDVGRYYKPVTPQDVENFKQAMAQNKAPDPTQMLAEVEREKTLADIEIARAKVNLDVMKAKMEDDRQRDRDEADMLLKAAEIEAKYGAQVDTKHIEAMQARERLAIDTIMQVANSHMDHQHRDEDRAMQERVAAQKSQMSAPPAAPTGVEG